jgi:hypothetical protein
VGIRVVLGRSGRVVLVEGWRRARSGLASPWLGAGRSLAQICPQVLRLEIGLDEAVSRGLPLGGAQVGGVVGVGVRVVEHIVLGRGRRSVGEVGTRRSGRFSLGLRVGVWRRHALSVHGRVLDVRLYGRHVAPLRNALAAVVPGRAGAGLREQHIAAVVGGVGLDVLEQRLLVDDAPRVHWRLTVGVWCSGTLRRIVFDAGRGRPCLLARAARLPRRVRVCVSLRACVVVVLRRCGRSAWRRGCAGLVGTRVLVGVSARALAVSHGCWRLAGGSGRGLVAPRVVRLMLRAVVVVVGADVVVGQRH